LLTRRRKYFKIRVDKLGASGFSVGMILSKIEFWYSEIHLRGVSISADDVTGWLTNSKDSFKARN